MIGRCGLTGVAVPQNLVGPARDANAYSSWTSSSPTTRCFPCPRWPSLPSPSPAATSPRTPQRTQSPGTRPDGPDCRGAVPAAAGQGSNVDPPRGDEVTRFRDSCGCGVSLARQAVAHAASARDAAFRSVRRERWPRRPGAAGLARLPAWGTQLSRSEPGAHWRPASITGGCR